MNLRIYWHPQVPCKAFYHRVSNILEGRVILEALAQYDLFLLYQGHRPDFSNAGGLQYFDDKEQDWFDWEDDNAEDIWNTSLLTYDKGVVSQTTTP